jgi:hypothetical protein
MPEALDDAALLQRIDSAIADGGRLPLFGRWQPRQGDQVSATPLWASSPTRPADQRPLDRREAAKTDA